MTITRIEFKGTTGHYATATHWGGAPNTIEVTIITPDHPNGLSVYVRVDDDDEMFKVATRLQRQLDTYQGTNSEIHDYYREIQRLGD